MIELARSLFVLTGSCGLVLLITLTLHAGSSRSRRAALLEALTILALLLVIVTGAAGALRLLTPPVTGVIWSAALVASVHWSGGEPQVRPPLFPSYTAPTLKAPGAHAGSEIPFTNDPLITASFPEATTGRMPVARALENAAA